MFSNLGSRSNLFRTHFLDAIASLAMPCNLGHLLRHSLRHSQSAKSPLLPLRFIMFRYGRVKEGPLWSWRVHVGQGKSMVGP